MLFSKSKAINYGIYLKDELLASGNIFIFKQPGLLCTSGNKTKGRSFGASHLVINTFIQQHAGKNMILDFEGSNIPEIAFFFKGFGAKAEEYPGIKYNALPATFTQIKKISSALCIFRIVGI